MVNRENALGTGGQLVKAWTDVIREMLNRNSDPVVPREFKQVLAFVPVSSYRFVDASACAQSNSFRRFF